MEKENETVLIQPISTEKSATPSQTSSYFWSENTSKMLCQVKHRVTWTTIFNAMVQAY